MMQKRTVYERKCEWCNRPFKTFVKHKKYEKKICGIRAANARRAERLRRYDALIEAAAQGR